MSEKNWCCNDTDYVIKELGTSLAGLTDSEANSRLEEYGHNELKESGGTSAIRMFLRQFTNPMVVILLIAVVISIAASLLPGGHESDGMIDAIVITGIVVFNSVFGFIQEHKSENAIEALKKMAVHHARVKRNGEWRQIDARELVPRDIISVEVGDRMAVDGRITSATGLSVDESILTGESIKVGKTEEVIYLEYPAVGDMKNMIFQGTAVVSGKGLAVTTATGMRTRLGMIAEMVQESDKGKTVLQRDFEDFGKKLGAFVIVVCFLLFIIEVYRSGHSTWVSTLLVAIALAVAAIPEGLPAVVTVTLAVGVQEMARRNAIVRKLHSVETLGSTTIICTDKTGTITRNEMTVRTIFVNDKTIQVSGTGYNRKGTFSRDDSDYNVMVDRDAVRLLEIGQLCNNSTLQAEESESVDWIVIGDPTEGALLVIAEKAGMAYDLTASKYEEIGEISFDSARKRMMTICRDESGNIWAFTKGAPEVLLALCSDILKDGQVSPLELSKKNDISQINAVMASQALRVMAFACRQLDDVVHDWEPESVERSMVFAGLMGMIDSPREEVHDAIRKCKRAGIRTIMITGDHELTAGAIAQDIGLIDAGSRIVNGKQIDKMSEEQLHSVVDECDVFARVAPQHKLQIVNVLKSQGHVVAMTGDGVNDAPAIENASVGVSMGIRGADVTKDCSDIVLTDDNFTTIVSAVEKGREVFGNIRKFVRFLLATNIGEVLIILSMLVLVLPLPITAIQILWINLVTDGFPAMALGVDPPEGGVMNRPPRSPNQGILDGNTIKFIILMGLMALFAMSFVFFWTLTVYGGWIPNITGPVVNWQSDTWASALTHARTNLFISLVFFQLVSVWNCRHEHSFFWKTSLWKSRLLVGAVILSTLLTLMVIFIPSLQVVFDIAPLQGIDWIVILAASLPGLMVPAYRIYRSPDESDIG